jgi:hypothetical protein
MRISRQLPSRVILVSALAAAADALPVWPMGTCVWNDAHGRRCERSRPAAAAWTGDVPPRRPDG